MWLLFGLTLSEFQIKAPPKVSYFFISLEKFVFDQFWAKFEWVSKNAVFFFRRCFFLRASDFEWVSAFKLFLVSGLFFFPDFFWKRVSEWPVNFSREIKKYDTFGPTHNPLFFLFRKTLIIKVKKTWRGLSLGYRKDSWNSTEKGQNLAVESLLLYQKNFRSSRKMSRFRQISTAKCLRTKKNIGKFH